MFNNNSDSFDKAKELVHRSYGINKSTNEMTNTEFIENLWFEENQDISSEQLSKNILGIKIHYLKENKTFYFKHDIMTYILDNFRVPADNRNFISKYLGLWEGWDFEFYIYTKDKTYFTNGIKKKKFFFDVV